MYRNEKLPYKNIFIFPNFESQNDHDHEAFKKGKFKTASQNTIN